MSLLSEMVVNSCSGFIIIVVWVGAGARRLLEFQQEKDSRLIECDVLATKQFYWSLLIVFVALAATGAAVRFGYSRDYFVTQ